MEILAVKQVRSVWLLPLADLNPSGRSLFPIIGEMVRRYSFMQGPAKVEDFDLAKGVKFAGELSKQAEELI